MPDKKSDLHICPDCTETVNAPVIQKMVEETVDLFFRHLDTTEADMPTVLIAAAMISSAMADEIISRARDSNDNFGEDQAVDACGMYVEMVDNFLDDLTNLNADEDDEDDLDDEDAAPASLH